MLKRNRFNDVRMLGDKGYDSEPLHKLARQQGVNLYAPVRRSSRKRPKGRFRRVCAKGADDYPRRNTVESFMHSLKAVHCSALKSRLSWMKKKEMALNILIYNLKKKIQNTINHFLKLIWDAPAQMSCAQIPLFQNEKRRINCLSDQQL